ncbi:3'-5' exonuclease [Collimonas humicola]|uniref:3'-5' exonuclease n=1 Tax=Collimonas humicola TaxID=2825886 RepID=UPI001B8B0DF9|nr:3'-5' exonuclease [Collimonas humicola]
MKNILVVDLEATCSDDGTIAAEKMETIEIGACWVDGDGIVIDRFQSFVQPVLNRRLTPFCTNLTGIQQENVDAAPQFHVAAELLRQFVDRHRTASSTWCSWGAYDRRQIERDSVLHGIVQPIELPHQNAKRLFAKAQRIGKEIGMAKACQLAGLALEGTHHRALDDSINVARLFPWVFGERSLKSQISS